MELNEGTPAYDLEEKTFQFAKSVLLLAKDLPKSVSGVEDLKQLIQSSGSLEASYIEANEEFIESENGKTILQEATELRQSFSSVENKSKLSE
ncbi:MAG: hypothetical protein ACOC0R_04670 [Mariniphaga sp.]